MRHIPDHMSRSLTSAHRSPPISTHISSCRRRNLRLTPPVFLWMTPLMRYWTRRLFVRRCRSMVSPSRRMWYWHLAEPRLSKDLSGLSPPLRRFVTGCTSCSSQYLTSTTIRSTRCTIDCCTSTRYGPPTSKRLRGTYPVLYVNGRGRKWWWCPPDKRHSPIFLSKSPYGHG